MVYYYPAENSICRVTFSISPITCDSELLHIATLKKESTASLDIKGEDLINSD